MNEALESKLGVRLPPSYRAFLSNYGAMAIYDATISGIFGGGGAPLDERGEWLYFDTMRFRNDWGLPSHLLVIQADEDAPYCLDTRSPSATGEFPVRSGWDESPPISTTGCAGSFFKVGRPTRVANTPLERSAAAV